MTREQFDQKELQLIGLCAGKNKRSLAAAIANWNDLVTHLKRVGWVFTGIGYVHKSGGIRVEGEMSGVPGIITLGNLHSTQVAGTVWTRVGGLCSNLMGRFSLRNGSFSIDNKVLDFVLGREEM